VEKWNGFSFIFKQQGEIFSLFCSSVLMVFSIFHFIANLIFSGIFPSTFQFMQQPVVEKWNGFLFIFKQQGEIFSLFCSFVLMVFSIFHFIVDLIFSGFFHLHFSFCSNGSESGMDCRSYPSYFQTPRSNLFLLICPHGFFHFSLF